MEYDNVTFSAYLSAAVVAALLTATYAYQRFKRQKTTFFALAAATHTLNMAVIAAAISGRVQSELWLLFFEALHYTMWVLAVHLTLSASASHKVMPRNMLVLFLLGWPITGLVLIAALAGWEWILPGAHWIILGLAVIGLVSVEQLFRFVASNSRQIKLLCMNLAALFLFDIYLFTHALIFQEVDPLLWQARAAVSSATCLFMALGGLLLLQQHSDYPASFTVSRPIAFYTTSLLCVSILIIMLALGGHYVRLYGGEWGTVIYSFAMIGAVLLITTMFVSTRIRSSLSVLVNKHLFRHKYDYRSEWLRLINFLAQPTDSSEANMRAFYAVVSITRAPGGALWVRKQNCYEPVYQAGLSYYLDLQEEPVDSPFCKTFLHSEWVFFPGGGDNQALSQHNELLPAWARNIPDLWLIFPLIVGEELIGFMALIKPVADAQLTWEDLDLLKTVGRQVASYLKRHQQAEQLAEGRQFDTYNKLVAFIIHDLNNLIAQQALVVRNAERHKGNPEFFEDAIRTIRNSVDRMNSLLKKLRQDSKDLVSRLPIREVLTQAIAEFGHDQPRLRVDLEDTDKTIDADQVRLVMTFTHFIKNALEATPDDGRVQVSLRTDDRNAIVTIEDNGTGMDWNFIRNRLFKPFETTKSGKGMGIGVYLSREYINELHGSLNILSAVGEGTTVTVTLPVNQGQELKQ